MRSAASSGVRLAELVATISLGTDLGLGQSMEHILRQTLVSLRMAELLAFDEAEREVAYFSGLLAWVGCHTDAYEQAKWSGSGRSSPSAMFTASLRRRFLPFSASLPAISVCCCIADAHGLEACWNGTSPSGSR